MQSEACIQQDAFTEIRNKHPETYGCIFHCPNGGLRDAVTATFMRGAGVVKGVQDLFFLWGGRVYIIEVKTLDGYCSTEQKLIHATHARQGFTTYIFTSSFDIIRFVESVLKQAPMEQYAPYISPYSNGDLVGKYREELRIERMKKLKKAA